MSRVRNGAAATVAAMALLATRYSIQRARVERLWLTGVEHKLNSIGEVDQLTVLPLVERLTPSDVLIGEAGVAYLLSAGDTTILFDVGLNRGAAGQSTLGQNAATLGADLSGLDAVVISHLHADHVGGFRSAMRGTFSLPAGRVPLSRLPAYVPTRMVHDRAEVLVTTEPHVIAPGVAVLPPVPQMLFWLGPIAEQALVVNVRDYGLVLVTGCGHPGIERILSATEQVLGLPIAAVIGGLHLPVHPFGTPLLVQAALGNPNWPWRLLGEDDVEAAIAELKARGPRLVALSSHDSTPWTFEAFGGAFGEGYRTLRVGEPITIAAGS